MDEKVFCKLWCILYTKLVFGMINMKMSDLSTSWKFRFFIAVPHVVCFCSALDDPSGMDGRSQQAPGEVTVLLRRAYVKSP